jgi:2-keto-myo-inositol isomerase
MMPLALNHMTVAKVDFAGLVDIAARLGCVGIEVRNDLAGALFDSMAPADAGAAARSRDLRLLALAEVKQFNIWSDAKRAEAAALIEIAVQAGAEAVSLIPRNDGQGMGNGERQANLRLALRELKPMLTAAGLIGMVEPLGFESCALRHKAEAVDAIEAVGGADCFKLVHDTFHHHLAGGGPIFAGQTGIVHLSGVTDPTLATAEMRDEHRLLVDGKDRLGNLEQIEALMADGYRGPLSMEAFAPEVHSLPSPEEEIARSFEFIRTRMRETVN